MSNTNKHKQKIDYQTLYMELEGRYGPASAQDIVDQVKKTNDQDNKPDYMTVKAVSEVLGVFRLDTKKAVKKLKSIKSRNLPANITDLEKKRQQK